MSEQEEKEMGLGQELNSPEVSPETIPEVNAETNSEQEQEVAEKKQQRLLQLKEARIAKKNKKALKEKEDSEIRKALISLKKDNEELRKKKRNRDDDDEIAPKKRKVRVTRVTENEEELEGQSIKTAAAKYALLAGLGLGSWFVQNRLFNNKKQRVQPNKAKKAKALSHQARPLFQAKQNYNTVPVLQTKSQTAVKNVGKSGFTL